MELTQGKCRSKVDDKMIESLKGHLTADELVLLQMVASENKNDRLDET